MASDFLSNLLLGAVQEGQQRKQQGQELALKVAEGQALHPYRQMDELLKLLNIQSLVESRKAMTEQRDKVQPGLFKLLDQIDNDLIIQSLGGPVSFVNNFTGKSLPILLQKRRNLLNQLKAQGRDITGLEEPPVLETSAMSQATNQSPSSTASSLIDQALGGDEEAIAKLRKLGAL